jgi:hypothetical protein
MPLRLVQPALLTCSVCVLAAPPTTVILPNDCDGKDMNARCMLVSLLLLGVDGFCKDLAVGQSFSVKQLMSSFG